MDDRLQEFVELSDRGLVRRREIEKALVASAAHRRLGRAAIGVAACAAVALAGALALRGMVVPARRGTEIVKHETPRSAPAPAPTIVEQTPSLAAAHIRVVVNEPLPERLCVTTPAGVAEPSTAPRVPTVGVCMLNDAQLISALSQTGQSYGIVRVGGTVRVLQNSGGQ